MHSASLSIPSEYKVQTQGKGAFSLLLAPLVKVVVAAAAVGVVAVTVVEEVLDAALEPLQS